MVKSRMDVIVFDVEKYIEINDFMNFNNVYLMATVVGIIEGNIHINKNNNTITLLDMYNIKCKNTDYIFLSIYNLIKNHSEIYKYIIKYFDLWHNKKQAELTYDDYHKNNLKDNFNSLISLIYNEYKLAIIDIDFEVVKLYEDLLNELSQEFK